MVRGLGGGGWVWGSGRARSREAFCVCQRGALAAEGVDFPLQGLPVWSMDRMEERASMGRKLCWIDPGPERPDS